MRIFLSIAAMCAASQMAHADVPVIDNLRLDKETSTAKCMKQARDFKDQSLKPVQGAKGSVIAPNAASASVAAAAPVGATGVMGLGASANSVGGLDLTSVLGAATGIGKLNSQSAAEAFTALGAVGNALGANASGLGAVGGGIGSLDPLQGAMDQNSAGRLAQGAEWGQVMQGSSVTLKQTNSKLLRQAQAVSAQSDLMRFDANAMVLVGGQK